MVGTLSEISERGQSCSVGRLNSGNCNVLSTLGRRGAGSLPNVPPGCLEGLIPEARTRMLILIILIILQSSYLHFKPTPVYGLGATCFVPSVAFKQKERASE